MHDAKINTIDNHKIWPGYQGSVTSIDSSPASPYWPKVRVTTFMKNNRDSDVDVLQSLQQRIQFTVLDKVGPVGK